VFCRLPAGWSTSHAALQGVKRSAWQSRQRIRILEMPLAETCQPACAVRQRPGSFAWLDGSSRAGERA